MAAPRRAPVQKPPQTVQKAPIPVERHRLDPAFPLRAMTWVLNDQPITRMHRHAALELGTCVGGTGTYVVAGKTFRFARGWSLIIGPREEHFSCSDKGTTSSWEYLFVEPEPLLAGIPGSAALPDHRLLGGPAFVNVLPPDDALSARIALLTAAALRPQRSISEIVGFLAAVLAEAQRRPGRLAPMTNHDNRLQPAWNMLAQPGPPAPVRRLARACGLSESAFRRAFYAVCGISPRAYLAGHRLDLAALRLRDPTYAVADAAADAGYASATSFSRAFRQRFSRAPRRTSGE